MTVDKFFETGAYKDFVAFDGEVFIFPAGYKLSRAPQEKSNIVSMADGHKRQDIIRRWEKFSFQWETILENDVIFLNNMVNAAPYVTERVLYLRKEHPAANSDYDHYGIDIITRPKTSYKFRGGIFVSGGMTIDFE